jgi:hypothetical protein
MVQQYVLEDTVESVKGKNQPLTTPFSTDCRNRQIDISEKCFFIVIPQLTKEGTTEPECTHFTIPKLMKPDIDHQ